MTDSAGHRSDRANPRQHRRRSTGHQHGAEHAARPSRLLTIAEVLAELQVARSTFDTWRSLGIAPECIKLPNGQIRIRRCALDSWLNTHMDQREV
jgi:predicted DNA-binding transcriptional regulator AlpA